MKIYRKVGAYRPDYQSIRGCGKEKTTAPRVAQNVFPSVEWSQHCVLTKHDSGGVRCAVLFQNFLFEIILFNLATEAKKSEKYT